MEVKRKSSSIMINVKEFGGTRCTLGLAVTTAEKATSLESDTFIWYKVITHSYLASSWKKLGLRIAIHLC